MAALTRSYDPTEKEGRVVAYAVGANKKVFQGALVCVDDATGYAEPATDAAGKTFAGVAYESAMNNPGAAGAASVRVRKSGTFALPFAGGAPTQAVVGKKAYASDDNTVALAATTANDVYVGDIVGLVGTDKVRVRIDRAAG
jgi:hypothetical protein